MVREKVCSAWSLNLSEALQLSWVLNNLWPQYKEIDGNETRSQPEMHLEAQPTTVRSFRRNQMLSLPCRCWRHRDSTSKPSHLRRILIKFHVLTRLVNRQHRLVMNRETFFIRLFYWFHRSNERGIWQRKQMTKKKHKFFNVYPNNNFVAKETLHHWFWSLKGCHDVRDEKITHGTVWPLSTAFQFNHKSCLILTKWHFIVIHNN